jgi:hypothetical protein
LRLRDRDHRHGQRLLGALQEGHGLGLVLHPEAAALAQPGQAPLGLLLLEEGVDRLADQGALASAATQRQGLQSLALRLREIGLGALHRADRRQ